MKFLLMRPEMKHLPCTIMNWAVCYLIPPQTPLVADSVVYRTRVVKTLGGQVVREVGFWTQQIHVFYLKTPSNELCHH